MMSPTELRERNRRRDRVYAALLFVAVLTLTCLILWAGHSLGMGS